jgi:hypothetical protein
VVASVVTKEYRKALHFFYLASSSGLADACYNLGVLVSRNNDHGKAQHALSLFSRGIMLLSSVASAPVPRLSTDFDDDGHGAGEAAWPDFATTVLRESLIEMQGEMLLRSRERRGIPSPKIECMSCSVMTSVFVPCMCSSCSPFSSSSSSSFSSSSSGSPHCHHHQQEQQQQQQQQQLSRCGLYYCSDICRLAESRQHVSPCHCPVASERGGGGGKRDRGHRGGGENGGAEDAAITSSSQALLSSERDTTAHHSDLQEAVRLWLTKIGLVQYL